MTTTTAKAEKVERIAKEFGTLALYGKPMLTMGEMKTVCKLARVELYDVMYFARYQQKRYARIYK